MIKNNKSKLILTSIILFLPLAAGLVLWKQLPDPMPTHWGLNGEIDGWSSKTFAVIGLPLFMLAIHWLCLLITSVDPKNRNVTSKPLQLIFWICPVISVITCSMMYAAAMGTDVNVNMIIPVIIGFVFIIVGNYLPKCHQNYTLGIKLPWTLHDEGNWNATHRFAGPVWVIGGILILISGFIVKPVIMIIALVPMIVLPTVYSYLYYKKHL